MGGKMPDCRRLVPRTPPEGMREWVSKTQAGALERWGLIYEAEWVADYFSFSLGETDNPKKRKMVRVTCSCCGGSIPLNWAYDQEHGYGFVLPEDEEGDWSHTVTTAGDECRCPMCNERVLVNKRSAIKDYYVTDESSCMSATLAGSGNLLALTCWIVQRRTFKSGHSSLEIIPAEAYVFSADGCAQLVGWRNSYSGQAGYFVQYTQAWRQPEAWEERWGEEVNIFGLTPELVAASCLPHCKLDVYMERLRGIGKRYPIVYLRLYQQHPNVEALLTQGLPLVLDDMIRERMEDKVEAPRRGMVALDEINWEETRPARMLGLTKDELRMAQSQEWGLLFWRLFVRTKAAGEVLTKEDIQNAFFLGDDHVLELVGQGPVGKSLRYLLRQCETLEDEVDSEGADWIPDVQTLMDYWSMASRLGRNLDDPAVRFPRDLLQAHEDMTELIKQREEDALANLFRVRRKQLRKYTFATDGLLIRPAASQRELTEEGDALHHCVSTYGKGHATGKTAIFFIRKASRPREPYYTLELNEKNLTVRQNRGLRNCAKTPEVQAFEDKWLEWLRGGCRRDKLGRPILGETVQRKVGAA